MKCSWHHLEAMKIQKNRGKYWFFLKLKISRNSFRKNWIKKRKFKKKRKMTHLLLRVIIEKTSSLNPIMGIGNFSKVLSTLGNLSNPGNLQWVDRNCNNLRRIEIQTLIHLLRLTIESI